MGREGVEPTEQAARNIELGFPQAEVGKGNRGEDRPREATDEDKPTLGFDHYTEEQNLRTSGYSASAGKAGEV